MKNYPGSLGRYIAQVSSCDGGTVDVRSCFFTYLRRVFSKFRAFLDSPVSSEVRTSPWPCKDGAWPYSLASQVQVLPPVQDP